MGNIRSTRQALTIPEALAFIRCVGAAADLQDKRAAPKPIARPKPPKRGTLAAAQQTFNLTDDEVTQVRKLCNTYRFYMSEAISIVLRDRQGVKTSKAEP